MSEMAIFRQTRRLQGFLKAPCRLAGDISLGESGRVAAAIRITELLVFCLPFIKLLAVLGTVGTATVYLFRGRSVRRWLRISMRITGGILVVPLALCVVMLLMMVACTSRPRIVVSPDSRHIAEYSYEAGFLGRDSTFVSVRSKWSLLRHDAYWYAGPSDWSGTEVRWLDNEHLLIRYTEDREGRPQHCSSKAVDVLVQCVADTPK
jgi:hypothetical protein